MKRSLMILIASGALLSGCSSMLWQTKPTEETVQRGAETLQFTTIAVIAGAASRNDLRMSATVRQELNDAGVIAVRRAGRWESENVALESVCPKGEAVNVDGLLFVYFDRLVLMECRTHRRVWEISGGDDAGLPGMTQRLIAYLQRRSKPATDSKE